MAPAALVGGGIGLVMGVVQYVIALAVIGRLIDSARSEEGPAEDEEEFQHKLAQMRRRLLVGSIVVLPLAGVVLGLAVGTR